MTQHTASAPLSAGRIVSLDALRGFIMFSMLLHTFGLEKVSENPVAGFFLFQFRHADWIGFHFEDIILPSFLFVIGVAMGLSEFRRREIGDSSRSRWLHAAKRAGTLFALGFLLSWIGAGKPYFGPGVLQVLAFSYFGAYIFLGKSLRFRIGVFGGLLFLYWFFIFIIPVPGAGRNSYVLFENLVYYLDNTLTGSTTRWGYLYPTITSIAVVVYGGIIGTLLHRRTSDRDFMKKLAVIGAVFIIAGLALHPAIPIIKRMFPTSYTLLSCGIISFIFLLFFYLIDLAGKKAWSLFFVVLGMNSIFVYLVNGLFRGWLLETGGIFLTPLIPLIGAWVTPLTHVLRLFAEWLLCLWLYKRKIFLKI